MTRLWSTDTDRGFFFWVNFTFLGSTFVTFSTLSTLLTLSVLLFLATTCFGQNFGKSKLIALKIHFVFGLNHLWRHHVGHESFVWTHLFCGVHRKGGGPMGGQWGRHREVSKQKLLLKRLLTIFTLFWKSFWRSSWQRNCVADFKKNLWPGIWI